MSRVYFNGVSQLAFNGQMLSFVLDDTYKKAFSETEKIQVVELISELEAVEGVCRYLLAEIEKIKMLNQNDQAERKVFADKDPFKNETELTLGPKLFQTGLEHS